MEFLSKALNDGTPELISSILCSLLQCTLDSTGLLFFGSKPLICTALLTIVSKNDVTIS